jgi:tetratricopeptide (TPR) repeat protein
MASVALDYSKLDPIVMNKISTAKQKKDAADQAFKAGQLQPALRSYHEALLYLLGIDKNALKAITGKRSLEEEKQSERTEIDDIIEKIYANMSACHLKGENWQRALETANKALNKNENNYKAMFRKGKALGELGFFERAEKVLEELKTKNPSDAADVTAELSRLRAIDQAREKVNKQKLKGFLTRERPEKKAGLNVDSSIEEIVSPGVASAAHA